MNSYFREARKIAIKIYKSNDPCKYDDYIGDTKWQKCCVAAFNRWRDTHDGYLSLIMDMFFNYKIDTRHENDYEYKKRKLFELIDKYMKIDGNATLENE